jgi:hypothetical protein
LSDPPFTLKESDRFVRQAEFELGDISRWDEIKEVLDLYVARDPLRFERVTGTNLYAVGISTIPRLTVFFSVDLEERIVTYEGLHRS